MKRLHLFAVIGVVAVTAVPTAHAQHAMLGIRGGVNLANELWSSPNYNYGPSISGRTLMLLGGEFDNWFNTSWGWSIQVLYDQKGAHNNMGNYPDYRPANGPVPPEYNGQADWTTSYLEIPLLITYRYGSGTVHPYVFAGPSLGFQLSNIERLRGTNLYNLNGQMVYYTVDTSANITTYTSPIDLSIVGGVGIALQLSTGQELFLDAAYAFGVLNTDNYSGDIRLAAGILFPLH